MSRTHLTITAAALLAAAGPAAARVAPVAQGGAVGGPSAVAVAGNGDILVADASGGVVRRLKADGTPVASFGARGSGAGQFLEGPTDVAIDDASATIAVADGARVQVFSAAGAFLRAGPSNGARFVAIAAGGATIYSSGGTACEVRRMDAALVVQATLVVDCAEPTGSARPVEVAVDGAGQLLVAGRVNSIKRVSATGATVETLETGANTGLLPLGLTVDRVRGQVIGRTWNGAGSVLRRYESTGVGAAQPLAAPVADVAVAPDHSIVAVETASQRVVRIDERPTAALRLVDGAPLVAGATATLSAAASAPAFDAIARYDWDLDGNGTFETAGGASPTRAITLAAGRRRPKVRVTDGAGHEDVAEVALDVAASTPRVVLNVPQAVLTDELVTLDARATTVPIGKVARFDWDRDGNGSYETRTGAAPTTLVKFRLPGTRTVRVRAVGQDGRSATAAAKIEVRPAPPAGAVGVVVNGGARFARTPGVALGLVWPRLAKSAVVANDPAFHGARTIALARTVRWTLPTGRSGRVATVYVRFVGSNRRASYDPDPAVVHSDAITIDSVAPRLRRAGAVARGGRTRVLLRARDDVSGLRLVRIARVPGGRELVTRYRKVVRIRSTARVLYVRVEDVAGNRSRYTRVKVRRAGR